MRRGILLGAVALLVAIPACRSSPPSAPPPSTSPTPPPAASQPSPGPSAPALKSNVVLIVVDALRADHLGVYGYGKPTSPHLDRLAREGVLFMHARATSSWTLPSVASILTGLYPAAHGADRATFALSNTVPTMPEAFRSAGYRTAAISANPSYVTPRHGLGRGFDEFHVEHGGLTEERRGDVMPADPWSRSFARVSGADVVTSRALEWVAAHDDGAAPYFLYLHYVDPHAGYFPPDAEATRFGVAVDDPLRGDAQWPVLASPKAPAADVVATLVGLYDAEIAHTDAEIGRLIAGVRGRPRPTLFVVVGDHGEELNDHGGMGHGRTLFDEVLRVPFLVAGPGLVAGRVIVNPVSLVSVWPTLAAVVGMPPPRNVSGIRLLDPDGSGEPPGAQHLFAHLERWNVGESPWHSRAVVVGSWKLIPGPPPWPTLFDLSLDPLEQLGVKVDRQMQLMQVILQNHVRTSKALRKRHPPRPIAAE